MNRFPLSCDRYHKNKTAQKPGWDRSIVDWCYEEAKKKNLREADFWGGFVIDEMKIEVYIMM